MGWTTGMTYPKLAAGKKLKNPDRESIIHLQDVFVVVDLLVLLNLEEVIVIFRMS